MMLGPGSTLRATAGVGCRGFVMEGYVMPAPRWLARFNQRVSNRIIGPVAPRLPGLGVVVHRGRKSHQQYRTPVNVFAADGRVVVALTYGKDSNWVQNVL